MRQPGRHYFCLRCQDSPSHYCLHHYCLQTVYHGMENEERPRSLITESRRTRQRWEESLRQRRERERGNSGKRAYAKRESVKDSSERLKPPKRGRCAAADAEKGIENVKDSSERLKPPKRGSYAATDVDEGIQRDAKRCLHWSERSVYSSSLITSSAG